MIRGTGGVKKMRVALPVLLVLAYSKEDLTGTERVAMRKLTALLAAES